MMSNTTVNDIVDWDIHNWWRAIKYWEQNVKTDRKQNYCLELGATHGGLSLWLALKGNLVLCTDLKNPECMAAPIHNKYECEVNINYAALDATDIPFENQFDIIVFKSILGGISQNNRDEYKAKTINEIYKALKPGGMLLFSENLTASSLHRILRRRYGTPAWNYLKIGEVDHLFSSFTSLTYKTIGFLGCMGRDERQKNILGRVDELLEFLIPEDKRYIISGIAIK